MNAVTRFPLAFLSRFTSTQIAVWTKAQDIGRPSPEATRRAGCYARDTFVADQLGMDRSTVSGAFRVLEKAGEILVTQAGSRRTRWTRPEKRGEKFVIVPHAARDELARLDAPLRLYGALTYAWTVQGAPAGGVALADLPRDLVAGLGLKPEPLRRAYRELEVRGWITKVAEGGGRGRVARHVVHAARVPMQLTMHGTPSAVSLNAVAPVEGLADVLLQSAAVEPCAGQGSLFEAAGQEAVNPLAESPETPPQNPRKPPREIPHKKTVLKGSVEEDEGVVDHRRRRQVRSVRETTTNVAATAQRPAAGSSTAGPERAPRGGKTLSPPIQITTTRDVALVLAAAQRLVDELPTGRQRGAQAAMANAVREYLAESPETPQRVADRIERRLRLWMLEDVRDPVAWFTGYALLRRGCADRMCDDGTIYDTGEACPACTAGHAVTVHADPAGLKGPECGTCGVPFRNKLTPHGTVCAGCRQEADEEAAQVAAAFADLRARLGITGESAVA